MESKDLGMKEPMMGKYPKWKVEHAADVIQEAMEIKKDSGMMGEVKKILKKKVESLEDLRAIANGDYEEEDDSEE